MAIEESDDPAALGFSVERLERLAGWMAGYVEGGRFPFAGLWIARRGRLAWRYHLGLSDLAAGTPFAPDGLARIYSMTKPVTSVALMMLYEQGLVRLDDPLAAYLPEFTEMRVLRANATHIDQVEPAGRAITLHDLLTHRSGLTYGFNGGVLGQAYQDQAIDCGPGPDDLAAIVARLARLPLLFEPGSRWNYSVSTDVLGRVIEVVSGQTLDHFLRSRIFTPLAMTDTGFAVADHDLERLTALYEADEAGGLRLRESAADSSFRVGAGRALSGGGGLVSTGGDTLRFAEMLRQGGALNGTRLLSPHTLRLMTANHLPADLASIATAGWSEVTFQGLGFGLGVAVMLDPARAQMSGSSGDFGWGGLASTVFWIDPAEELSVVFLTQLIPSDRYPYRRELRALVYSALVE